MCEKGKKQNGRGGERATCGRSVPGQEEEVVVVVGPSLRSSSNSSPPLTPPGAPPVFPKRRGGGPGEASQAEAPLTAPGWAARVRGSWTWLLSRLSFSCSCPRGRRRRRRQGAVRERGGGPLLAGGGGTGLVVRQGGGVPGPGHVESSVPGYCWTGGSEGPRAPPPPSGQAQLPPAGCMSWCPRAGLGSLVGR